MEGITAGPELGTVIVGIDPVRDWHMALAWAADAAHRRARGLGLALAVPPQHDTQHVDGTTHRIDLRRSGSQTLEAAALRAISVWHQPLLSFQDENVGRRGIGGYTGMRLGSAVHGLLHRAHCPVITVPVAQGT